VNHRLKDALKWIGVLYLTCLTACQPVALQAASAPTRAASPAPDLAPSPVPVLTPFPTRPAYAPGELVDYIAQTGDTLPALAVHFNTRVAEILAANTFIPVDATTLPPGMPMKIPVYYAPFWGSPYQILPDSLFVNGPAQVDFDTQAFVAGYSGWLAGYREFASDANRSGAQIIDRVAQNFSVSPRLLLALLEYQAGALTQPVLPAHRQEYPLGYEDWQHKGLYLQLVWAANALNNGYYGWRTGRLASFDLLNGRSERPDPWQNAATVGLQYYFSRLLPQDGYAYAIAPEGLADTYRALFGDPWANPQPHIPGSLRQPELTLPFAPGLPWAYTGGPHTAWGQGDPLAALDFAPPAVASGCTPTDEWSVAMAAGRVARSEPAIVVLDLDGETPADGDERTGWVIFYLHLATEGRARAGAILKAGDPVGHPSCEGGQATGTHIHIARKYNGEWAPAEGPLAFDLEGWVAYNGAQPYLGTLQRFSQVITACTCSDQGSQLEAGEK
jgi:hypothetical protein